MTVLVLAMCRTGWWRAEQEQGYFDRKLAPIACLNLLCKLLPGIFAEKAYLNLLANKLLPYEQKGCRKDSRGIKDHLVNDQAVLQN